jgi:hypothetical protein
MMLAIPSILAAPVPEPEPEPELADCSLGDWRKARCDAITGPNGGPGACIFKRNEDRVDFRKCVNKRSFVDLSPKALFADCTVGDRRRAVCEAISGPNGGAGACSFKGNKNQPNFRKCINTISFVDDAPGPTPTPTPEVADCSVGNWKRKVCEAITGSNGALACAYKLNENKANFRKCVNKKSFDDAEPEPESEVADCSVGNWKRKVCEAITGPNGARACAYKRNENKANYRKCEAV